MADTPRASSLPRFTLASFLLVIAGLAMCLGLISQLGWLGVVLVWIGAIVLVVAYRVCSREPGQRRRHLYALVALGLLPVAVWCGFLGLFFSDVIRMRPSHVTCDGRIAYLVAVFHLYALDHGDFPPAFVADSSGKPMHSWRVLILPYLNENALYRSYNMNEPWNGPNNSKLASKVPDLLRCPSDRDLGEGETSYFCIVGPGRAAAPPGGPGDPDESPTVMLVESSTAGINWLEPRDLTIEEVVRARTGDSSRRDQVLHDGGGDGYLMRSPPAFHVALDNLTTLRLRSDIDAESLRALLASGDVTTLDLGDVVAKPLVWPGVWVLTAAEVAFLTFVIIRRVRRSRLA